MWKRIFILPENVLFYSFLSSFFFSPFGKWINIFCYITPLSLSPHRQGNGIELAVVFIDCGFLQFVDINSISMMAFYLFVFPDDGEEACLLYAKHEVSQPFSYLLYSPANRDSALKIKVCDGWWQLVGGLVFVIDPRETLCVFCSLTRRAQKRGKPQKWRAHLRLRGLYGACFFFFSDVIS